MFVWQLLAFQRWKSLLHYHNILKTRATLSSGKKEKHHIVPYNMHLLSFHFHRKWCHWRRWFILSKCWRVWLTNKPLDKTWKTKTAVFSQIHTTTTIGGISYLFTRHAIDHCKSPMLASQLFEATIVEFYVPPFSISNQISSIPCVIPGPVGSTF